MTSTINFTEKRPSNIDDLQYIDYAPVTGDIRISGTTDGGTFYNNFYPKFNADGSVNFGYDHVRQSIGNRLDGFDLAIQRFFGRRRVFDQLRYAPRFFNEGQYSGAIAGRDAADEVFGEALLGVPEA